MFDDVGQLIDLFNRTFAKFNTVLVAGDDEPIYLPAGAMSEQNQVIFAHGFFASALHEIAHWCLAGDERRTLEDYGYWYNGDGRDQQQQLEFEKVEVKPQAIEYAFALAAGREFQVSVDNLSGFQSNRHAFSKAVEQQYQAYLQTCFPPRAQLFIDALRQTVDSSLNEAAQ
ncbi:elongation factor P hydroxylase [Agarivorans sp. MS3-6]|uniref:elongation factor P hydroxylase n=1 Tax=Agarivorans sp. TSD2052 TaxID=2937286 RepID=UPI00200D3EE8|nr:elongation factor P hydroxylase [Agarivorans sp. TSD2052]UPW20219.1 elongation factor P hydroxylase [Agarivorans sp. TSD2052]